MSRDDDLMNELRQAQEDFKKMEDTSAISETETTEEVSEGSEAVETAPERSYTETEQKAIEQGWNPNYQGDDAKSAEQFVRDGSFFKKIDSQKKEINELRDAFKQLSSHQKKVEKAAYERALSEIRATRDAAIEVGDVIKVNALDEHIDNHKQHIKALEQEQQVEPVQQAPHPEAINFKERNKDWFGKYDSSVDPSSLSGEDKINYQMTKAAMTYDEYIGMKVSSGALNLSPEEAIKAVEDFIKETYAHKFSKENVNKSAPAAVLTSTSGETGTKGKYNSRMTDRQREVYQMFKKQDPKFGTIEEFAQHLDMIGELKK